MDLDYVSAHNHAKKELGQYPAILTSHLVNNPYIQVCARQAMLFGLFEVTFVIRVSSVFHLTELEIGFSVCFE